MIEAKTFDEEDRELERMVNPATAARRRLAEQRGALDAEYADIPDDTFEGRWHNLKRLTAALARAAVGCVFLGSITRGWIAPVLGLAAGAACFLWAWLYYRGARRV